MDTFGTLTDHSSQWVITIIEIFFFITYVKILSDHFYSVSKNARMMCVCVCVCVSVCEKGFTYAVNKLHHR